MKRVLITGGTRGIGRAAVERFSALGMDVTFFYKNREELATSLSKESGARAVRCDIASGLSVKEAVFAEEKAFGGFDILINNAGIAEFSLFTDITDEAWERMLSTNLSGAFYCCKAVLPHMIRQKWGRIINVSSMWGLVGSSCEVHYSAAKAGLIGLTKALAKEEGPSGITVNCIAPGVIDTEMNQGLGEETLRELMAETPAGRLGTAAEVAALMTYLASEEAGFVTGQVICQSGGLVC